MGIRSEITNFQMDEPLLRCVAKQSDFLLAESFTASWYYNNVRRIRVSPGGWMTDLASVPQEAWAIVPPHKLIKRPAIIHDDLYEHRPFFAGTRITKEEADAVFWRACIDEGVPMWQADTAYFAVRNFGDDIWHAHDTFFAEMDRVEMVSNL